MSLPFQKSTISRAHSPSIPEEVKLLRRSGRGIRKLVLLCGPVSQLVDEHDRRLLGSGPDDDDDNNGDDNNNDETKEEIDRYVL